MNSPCIVISRYESFGQPMSPINAGSGCNFTPVGSALWLLNPRSSSPNSPSYSNAPPSQNGAHQFANTCQDISAIMDRYRNLMFDFTFPETVDFRDLLSGQLAATYRSTVVAEHGWKLRELVGMLKGISAPGNNAKLERHIGQIEASLSEVKFWVEEQRTQQLIQERRGFDTPSR